MFILKTLWTYHKHLGTQKKLKYLWILPIFLISGWVNGKSFPELPKKLYNHIIKSQIYNHPNSRYIGSWPIRLTQGNPIQLSLEETNIFVPLQIMLGLEALSNSYYLPKYPLVKLLFQQQLRQYIKDRHTLQAPPGSINYWPLLTLNDGSHLYGFVHNRELMDSLNLGNLANDTDTSSRAVLWLLRSSHQYHHFIQAYIEHIGKYVDRNRASQHPKEDLWKQPNSGAFLTWNHEQYGATNNNVDCVVNLNVIASLGAYRQIFHTLPEDAEAALNASCKLMAHALETKKVPQCSIYYDRASQFLAAYVKAAETAPNCLNKSKTPALELVKQMSQKALLTEDTKPFVEIAELIVAYKALVPHQQRDSGDLKLINKLEKRLKQGLTITKHTANLPSESVHIGGPFVWRSAAYTTLIALEAITGN